APPGGNAPPVVEDRTAEGLAAPCIVDGLVDDELVRLQAGGRAPQPLLLELDHLIGETLALLADAVTLGDADIVEEDLRGVGGAHAHLVELSCDLHTPGLHGDADQRL